MIRMLLQKPWKAEHLDVIVGNTVVVECDSGDLEGLDAATLAHHIAACHDCLPALQALYGLAQRELGSRLTHHPALTAARVALARAGVHHE
jgi:hypothetical protein